MKITPDLPPPTKADTAFHFTLVATDDKKAIFKHIEGDMSIETAGIMPEVLVAVLQSILADHDLSKASSLAFSIVPNDPHPS